MKSLFVPLGLMVGLVTSACVTINVYFPAAAAQAAADKVIDEVWGGAASPPKDSPEETAPPTSRATPGAVRLAKWWLDALVPAAQAAEPDIQVSSPAIRELTQSMEARFASLQPHLDAGAIGIGKDGFVAIRDAGAVPLAQRNALRKLVANENADRAQLYKEIAAANGQPQWEDKIRQVFAKRWIARAKPGWQIEADSGWQAK